MVEDDIITYVEKQKRNTGKELTEKETLDFLDDRLNLESKYGHKLESMINEYRNENVFKDIKNDLIDANFRLDVAKGIPKTKKNYVLDFVASGQESGKSYISWSDPRIGREVSRYKQLVAYILDFLDEYPNTTEWLRDSLTHLKFQYQSMVNEYERMNSEYFNKNGDFLEDIVNFIDREMFPLFEKTTDFISNVDRMLDNVNNDSEISFLTKIKDILEA